MSGGRRVPVGPLTWLGRPWHNRAWWHPLIAAASVYLAGQVIWATRLHPMMVVGIAAATAAAAILSTAGDRYAEATRWTMAGFGAAAAVWLLWIRATTPYGQWQIVAALIAVLVATGCYPAMRLAQVEHEHRWRAYRSAQPPTPHSGGRAAKWEQLLASVGAPGMRFVERTPNRAGFTVRMRLPATGQVTLARLAENIAEALEIATRMPTGSVRVEPATNRDGRVMAGEVLIHFDVRDILTERIDMPDHHGPLSVSDAFPVGMYADGAPINLTLREIAALIVGVRGRGKTNLLNVIIYQLSRCTDVVLWGMDLKGGRAIRPWIQPYLDGAVDRPLFDWVATTRQEAHRMLVGARALIQHRSRVAAGGSKIVPSRQLPAVIVVCDEWAALVGTHTGPKSSREGATSYDLAGVATMCIQLGRSEAVDFVLATQRATTTMTGGGDLKSQCELRIGLGVTSAQDASSVFTGEPVAAKLLAKLKGSATRGAILVQDGDEARIATGKTFFLPDERVPAAALAHAGYPAEVEQAGAEAVDAAVRALPYGGGGYYDRWSTARAGHLRGVIPQECREPAAPDAAARDVQAVAFTDADSGANAGGTQALDDATVDREFARITGQLEDGGQVDRYERLIAIVAESGSAGMIPNEIHARMQDEGIAWPQRTQIYRALHRAISEGRLVQPAGHRGRYYAFNVKIDG